MTDEEAREKVCPFMSEGWFLREAEVSHKTAKQYCIASDCMMWVWDRGDAMINGILESDVLLDTGYCGLVRIS